MNGVTDSLVALATAQHVSKLFRHCSSKPSLYAGLLSYFCPCIQFGNNAEALGESCVLYALSMFVPILGLYCRTSVRGRIREQKGIEGSCFKDLLCVLCCAFCSLAQEAQVRCYTLRHFKKHVNEHVLLLIIFFSRNCKDLRASPWVVNERIISIVEFSYYRGFQN